MVEKMRQRKLLSSALVLATLTVGILIGTILTSHLGPAQAQSGVSDAKPLTVPPMTRIGNEFSELARRLENSVVHISVEALPEEPGAPDAQEQEEGGELPELFRRFFPDGRAPEPSPRQASGTGFIVDPNGYIITNNHVVENATKIRVKLHNDDRDYRARVIGTDYESDLAVIKIDARSPLAPVQIANSESVQVGDWAVAIGSPFGLEATVTAGIVSATGRGVDEVGQGRRFQSFIQTDAAINPGNSGGPLLNIKGEVVGVNTMIATTRGGSEGVGFALPINLAVKVYNDIIRDGRVTRGSIGVTLMYIPNHEAAMKGLGVGSGALIEEVANDGPAGKAGLQADDIVTGINGKPVKNNDDLIAKVADLPVGQPATLNVDRDGKKLDLKITIADRFEMYKNRPEIVGRNRKLDASPDTSRTPGEVKFGIQLRGGQLTDDERTMVKGGKGVVIASVVEGSFAEETGLETNDIILSINRKPVTTLDDVKRVQQSLKPGDPVVFQLVRRGRPAAGGKRGRPAIQPAALYLAGNLPEN